MARPITLSSACEHLVANLILRTLLLPSSIARLATRSRTPFRVHLARPFLPIDRSQSASREGQVTTLVGVTEYHQTLFKGTDGRRLATPADELAWLVRRHRWSCIRVPPNHASNERSRRSKAGKLPTLLLECDPNCPRDPKRPDKSTKL